jgi:hypothetical protein
MAGRSPARNSDDLPAPDGPTTISGPPVSSRSASRPASSAVSVPAEEPPRLLSAEWGQPRVRALDVTRICGDDPARFLAGAFVVDMYIAAGQRGVPVAGDPGIQVYVTHRCAIPSRHDDAAVARCTRPDGDVRGGRRVRDQLPEGGGDAGIGGGQSPQAARPFCGGELRRGWLIAVGEGDPSTGQVGVHGSYLLGTYPAPHRHYGLACRLPPFGRQRLDQCGRRRGCEFSKFGVHLSTLRPALES